MNKEKQPMSNKFFTLFDPILEQFSQETYIAPELLMTKNRKDIEYRVQFLQEVNDMTKSPSQTLYYQFISDPDRGIIRDSNESSNEFLDMYNKIKKIGIKKPLLVAKYNSDYINTRHILKEKKFWKKYKNETGFQLVDGAHRLAIALYLELKEIPVKIIKSLSFEIPNYTDYIQLKEKDYLANIR